MYQKLKKCTKELLTPTLQTPLKNNQPSNEPKNKPTNIAQTRANLNQGKCEKKKILQALKKKMKLGSKIRIMAFELKQIIF